LTIIWASTRLGLNAFEPKNRGKLFFRLVGQALEISPVAREKIKAKKNQVAGAAEAHPGVNLNAPLF
jgi:hypothetical protein